MKTKSLPTPRFSAALRDHSAANDLSNQTLWRRLAGQWPAATALLWNNPDLLALWLQDALEASGVVVDQELLDKVQQEINRGKGTESTTTQ